MRRPRLTWLGLRYATHLLDVRLSTRNLYVQVWVVSVQQQEQRLRGASFVRRE